MRQRLNIFLNQLANAVLPAAVVGGADALLLETGDYLLLETGDKLLLE
jgi:hypothetical protein